MSDRAFDAAERAVTEAMRGSYRETKNEWGRIARAAVEAYERERVQPPGVTLDQHARVIEELAAACDRAGELESAGKALVDAIHRLDSYAASSFPCSVGCSEEADAAVERWRALVNR